MDEQKEAVNENAEDTSVVEAPTTETNPSQAQDEEVKTSEITEEAATDSEPKDDKKFNGAQKRIHNLVSDNKGLKEENRSLAEKVRQLTEGYQPQPQAGLPQSDVVPGAEITPDQYRQDVAKTADALVQIRLNQQRVIDNINRETGEVIKSYPELDPDNKDGFDKELSESVSEATMAYVRSNPTGSVKKFVDQLMKPYKRSIEKRVGEDTEKVAKQASQVALRPTNVKAKETPFSNLSLKEMEKKLGVVY